MPKTKPASLWRNVGVAFPLWELRDVDYKAEVYPIKGQDGPWTWTLSTLGGYPVMNLAIGRDFSRLDAALVDAQSALREWVIHQHRSRARQA